MTMSIVAQKVSTLVPGDVIAQNFRIVEGGKVKTSGRTISVTSVQEQVVTYKGMLISVVQVIGIDNGRPVDPAKPEEVGWVRWLATPLSRVAVIR